MESPPTDAVDLYAQGMKPSRWETEETEERNYLEDSDLKNSFNPPLRGSKSRTMSLSPEGKRGKRSSSVKKKSLHDKKKKKKKKKDSKEKDLKGKRKSSKEKKKKSSHSLPEGLEEKDSSNLDEVNVEKQGDSVPLLKTKEPASWSEFHKEKYTINNFRELREYWASIRRKEEEEKERERLKQLEEANSKKHSKKQLRPPTPPPVSSLSDLQEKKSLFDSPRELRNTVKVEKADGEEFYVPSWMVKKTTSEPVLTFSYNPKVVEPPKFMNREEMLKSLPLEILQLINDFFILTTDRGTA